MNLFDKYKPTVVCGVGFLFGGLVGVGIGFLIGGETAVVIGYAAGAVLCALLTPRFLK